MSEPYYNLSKLNKKTIVALMKKAMEQGFGIQVEQLDCTKSFRREAAKMTPAQFFKLKTIQWFFIYRQQVGITPHHYEVGGWILLKPGATEYFLRVKLAVFDAKALALEFNLEIIK
jgi:hypothetical protein